MPGVAIVMKNQVGEEVETCVESAGASCDQHNSNKSSMAVGGGMAGVAELQTAVTLTPGLMSVTSTCSTTTFFTGLKAVKKQTQ